MSLSAPPNLAHLDVENRRVLLRVDLDRLADASWRPKVPDSSLSTLRELMHRGARVILAGHRSPSQPQDPQPSLRRAGSRLAEALNAPVSLPDEVVGDGVRKLVRDTRGGQIVLLENLALDPREAGSSGALDFARQLAQLCDVFVLDAPQASLDPRSSITGVPPLLPENLRGVGHRVEAHLEAVRSMTAPFEPSSTLIFGAKAPDLMSLAALAKLVEAQAPKNALILGGGLGRAFARVHLGLPDPELASQDPQVPSHLQAILREIQAKALNLVLPYDLDAGEAKDALPLDAPELETAPLLRWGRQSRRDLISALHAERVLWLGSVDHHQASTPQDDPWIAQRLAQHERPVLAVGPRVVAALQACGTTSAEQLRCRDFLVAALARAPIPGLQALQV